MALFELRTYRVSPGASVEGLIRFFRSDGATDYRAALREAGIEFIAAWRTVGRDDELVRIRAFRDAAHKESACAALYGGKLWRGGLKAQASDLVDEVETLDLNVQDAAELLRGPRDRGLHELRHYRLAPGTAPKMLAFFEDVRRINAEFGVRVLAWFLASVDGTDRFLWLREFRDAAHKEEVIRDLYGGERWARDFKPRAAGVIEERILKDLVPLPADD